MTYEGRKLALNYKKKIIIILKFFAVTIVYEISVYIGIEASVNS